MTWYNKSSTLVGIIYPILLFFLSEGFSSLFVELNSNLLIIILEDLLLNWAKDYVVGAARILKGVRPSEMRDD